MQSRYVGLDYHIALNLPSCLILVRNRTKILLMELFKNYYTTKKFNFKVISTLYLFTVYLFPFFIHKLSSYRIYNIEEFMSGSMRMGRKKRKKNIQQKICEFTYHRKGLHKKLLCLRKSMAEVYHTLNPDC